MKNLNKMSAEELSEEVFSLQWKFDNMSEETYDSPETTKLVQRQSEAVDKYFELTGAKLFS